MNFRHNFNKILKTRIPENPRVFTRTRQKPEDWNPDPTRTREVIPEPDPNPTFATRLHHYRRLFFIGDGLYLSKICCKAAGPKQSLFLLSNLFIFTRSFLRNFFRHINFFLAWKESWILIFGIFHRHFWFVPRRPWFVHKHNAEWLDSFGQKSQLYGKIVKRRHIFRNFH